MKKRILESLTLIREKIDKNPSIGIILGTGLESLAEEVENPVVVSYKEIPHFPISTVHLGRLCFGKLEGKDVVIMQGRVHYYEGYSFKEVTYPVMVLSFLGVKILIISNASGGLLKEFNPSDIMVIRDHINFMGDNPLRGPNDPELGPRFPDMSNCYDRGLIRFVERVAEENRIALRKGVYVGVMGPSLETAAEYRFFHRMGADAIGMSTIPEVIIARYRGMKVLALSVITNVADPDNLKPTTQGDVIEIAQKAAPKLLTLIRGVMARINE